MTTTALPCPEHGWRSQFCLPTGMLGWIVGHLMALKNRERSEWVLSRLNLDETDRVLEIGFGSGADVRRAAGLAAHVSGIDPSSVMLNQALRRNRMAVEAGRVELRLGAMPVLPFGRERFTKAFSINSFQFWPDKVAGLCELRRVMTPGGIVAIAVQPRNSGATDDTARQTGDEIARALTAAGFRDVQLGFRDMKPVSTACAIAKT
jgi:ubiquinone/menaquinone biosynthesis C-methylase UbiE